MFGKQHDPRPAVWFEPVRNWIQDASRLGEIAKSEDIPSKKSLLQKVFGLNLSIHAREARGNPIPPLRGASRRAHFGL